MTETMYKTDLYNKWLYEKSRMERELDTHREHLELAEEERHYDDAADELCESLANEIRFSELEIGVTSELLADVFDLRVARDAADGTQDTRFGDSNLSREDFLDKWLSRRDALLGRVRELKELIAFEIEVTRQTAGLTDWGVVERSEVEKTESEVAIGVMYNVLNDVAGLELG